MAVPPRATTSYISLPAAPPISYEEQQIVRLNRDSSSYKYQTEIGAMMFTFGDVRHSNTETTQLVEDVVRAQIIEILVQAAQLAKRRSSRYFSHEDLIFLIRRDRLKMARLTSYLGWRKVRKIANRTGNSAEVDEELVEEGGEEKGGGKVKKQSIKLSWSLLDQFDDIMAGAASDSDDNEGDDEYFQESLQRLKYADQVTQAMSQEEYMDYAECRQASFTYKKPSRFREWLNIENLTGMRPNNDLLDVLGFLCYEMVRTLTEQSLAVKHEMEKARKNETDRPSEYIERHLGGEKMANIAKSAREQYRSYSIFKSQDARTAIEPLHVMEAHRRLQSNQASVLAGTRPIDNVSVRNNSKHCLKLFHGGFVKESRNLI